MKDSLGDRIKKYESITKHSALPNMPLVVRVDGKAFHTFTRNCIKPFDKYIIGGMLRAAMYTATKMQGFKAAYVQSDEVTFVLTDYDTHQTDGWFDYELPKIISTSAALMSVSFLDIMKELKPEYIKPNNLPTFDARAFNVPKNDVINMFLWRALDWKRNSVQMYGQSVFSHKEMQGWNEENIKRMLIHRGFDWDKDLSNQTKYGTFITKKYGTFDYIYTVPTYSDISKLLVDFETLGG